MTLMENRVSSLESSVLENNGRILDVEASRAMDSQTCDELLEKQKSIDSVLKGERDRIKQLSNNYDTLKKQNHNLLEEVQDLQSRSMRDNLLFFGLDECKSFDERKSENCMNKIYSFLQNTLNITDAREKIKIDRAHRIGNYVNSKTRPIVVKFNFYQDKLTVKERVRDVTKDQDHPSFRVGDQFPKAVQEKRRKLIPTLIAAKRANKNAWLSYDKLCIDGKMFTVDTVSRAGYDTY
ncbi:uncharacterized protein LOC132724230 [Ruditapes philippinarum]|uniref:uncharacterized protein LOC132724230 n=1 Tax=Ruditapes philippinarum TaxID=129788 RepID=UPI00295C03BE|nr:uncharacterized protein LOC132724230 [Ruditapes philippinarum]